MILHERRGGRIASVVVVVEIRVRGGGVIPGALPYQALQILGQAAALPSIVPRGDEAIGRGVVAQQEGVVEQLAVSSVADDLVVARPGRARGPTEMMAGRLARAPDRALAVRDPELVQQLLVTHHPRLLLLAPLPLELPGQLVDLVRDYRVELGEDVVRPIADVLDGVAAPAPGGVVVASRAFRGRRIFDDWLDERVSSRLHHRRLRGVVILWLVCNDQGSGRRRIDDFTDLFL